MPFDLTQGAYVSLRSIVSERTSPIVAWMGAGLSATAGIPMWESLRGQLTSGLQKKIESMSPSDRSNEGKSVSKIIEQKNPWIAFQMLEKQLGVTTYRDIIREAMRPADTALAPESYRSIWKLRVRGVINLNIDRLATQAFIQTRNSKPLEFTGSQGVKQGHLLKEPRPFILNMHGHADDHTSWVFTKAELDRLRASPGYVEFIRGCLFANTVLFLGISADDLAVGGHLENLSNVGINSGTHFWVTSRIDKSTDKWAESVGIRVIRYDAPKGDHSALDEMFLDLISFVPPEDSRLKLPVVPLSADSNTIELPPVLELAKRDANDIRRILNNHLMALSKKGEATAIEYSEFTTKYDEAIYRAWYINTRNKPESLLDYELHALVAKGAFGAVYRATNEKKESLAIKVLLEEIRNDDTLLQSFRRGVRSMKILGSNNVDGVVAYRDSSEIPAFVVMDWVEGPSLQEAVDAKQLQEWHLILRTLKHLTKIVRQAHELPERVLHRDLRPSNVMLKDFYTDPEDWKLVVLDFDLSWHRGATEKSVVHGSTLFGYLAPEQIMKAPGISTRHSAVDSFGLGMIFFFVISGRHPVPAEHKHLQWIETVKSAARDCDEWKSLPNRFCRLILAATHDQQAKRWDVTQIENELSRLSVASLNSKKVIAPDLIAEEVAARTDVLRGYEWQNDETSARAEFPTGLRITIRGCSVSQQLQLNIEWGHTGVQRHQKVGRFLKPAAQSCAAILKSNGWETRIDIDSQALRVRATLNSDAAVANLDRCAENIDKSIEPLRTR